MRALLVSTLLLLVGSGSLACDAYEATTSGAESAPPAVAGRETTAPSPAEPAYAVVSWEDARGAIGEVVIVEGPVADTLGAELDEADERRTQHAQSQIAGLRE